MAKEVRGDSELTRSVLAVAAQVAGIVRRILAHPEYRVLLFGSWPRGDARPASDIDIGIDGPSPVDAVTMQRIRDACDRLSTMRTVDVVDFWVLPPSVRENARSGAVDLGSAA